MEPITLCGAIVLIFCIWLEFEPAITRIAKAIANIDILAGIFSSSTVQRPAYVKYMENAR